VNSALITSVAQLPRPQALSAMSKSIRVLLALGDVEALEVIRRAVNDTARWYP
jgi:hypothetical protein